jgi:hypothetical protein
VTGRSIALFVAGAVDAIPCQPPAWAESDPFALSPAGTSS